MDIYKFQHTIQIIRWNGLNTGKYDYDAWVSISKAINTRLTQEAHLQAEMKNCKELSKSF